MSESEVQASPSAVQPGTAVGGSLALVQSTGDVSPSLVGRLPGDPERVSPVLCHYCGILPGSTKDHIVPRTLLDPVDRMNGKVTENSVKACTYCNNRKGNMRVDCCVVCLAAWQRWGPPDWEITVQVVSKIWVAKKARGLARG